jgi:hypothetical protein
MITPFDIIMRIHGILHLPAMTPKERSLYKRLLLSFDPARPLRIFEYGSGFSTIYFSRMLKKRGRHFTLHSIDNNRIWHHRVQEMVRKYGLSDSVTLHIRSFPPFWEKPQWRWGHPPRCNEFAPKTEEENGYVSLPISLDQKFDCIFVDGRFRRRAIAAAAESLSPNGIVVLHDAQKSHYHPGLDTYKFSRFFSSGKYYPLDPGNWKLWAGSPRNPIVNRLNLSS